MGVSTSRARGAPDGTRGRARSPGPCTKNAAFENSTAGCEAMPSAVETRSEFRYKFSASSFPRSLFAVDLRMAVALLAKWGGSRFPCDAQGDGKRSGCLRLCPHSPRQGPRRGYHFLQARLEEFDPSTYNRHRRPPPGSHRRLGDR